MREGKEWEGTAVDLYAAVCGGAALHGIPQVGGDRYLYHFLVVPREGVPRLYVGDRGGRAEKRKKCTSDVRRSVLAFCTREPEKVVSGSWHSKPEVELGRARRMGAACRRRRRCRRTGGVVHEEAHGSEEGRAAGGILV